MRMQFGRMYDVLWARCPDVYQGWTPQHIAHRGRLRVHSRKPAHDCDAKNPSCFCPTSRGSLSNRRTPPGPRRHAAGTASFSVLRVAIRSQRKRSVVGRRDNESDLPAWRMRVEMRSQHLRGSPPRFLMDLCQLPAHAHQPSGFHLCEQRESFHQPMRRLEKHAGNFRLKRPTQRVFSSAAFRRKKPAEKPLAAAESGTGNGCRRCARSGCDQHWHADLVAGLNQPSSGVGNSGHPSVTDAGHAFSTLEPWQQLRSPGRFVVLVKTQERRLNFIVRQQPLRMPCVFSSDHAY